MIAEICQGVLDRFGMPADLALRKVAPFFKGKGDIRHCYRYRYVKLLQNGMKVVERVL